MAAEEAATWKLVFTDAEENPTSSVEVARFHTTETSSAAKAYPADRDALALPRMPSVNAWVNSGGKIVVEAMSDAADTVESEESEGMIPIKLKNKTNGTITHRKLRFGDAGTADFTGFAATADVALINTAFRRLGAYTVPDGHMATLDAGQPVHLYLGDDT